MQLEEEFDLEISEEDAEKIRTIADAIRYMRRRRQDEDRPWNLLSRDSKAKNLLGYWPPLINEGNHSKCNALH